MLILLGHAVELTVGHAEQAVDFLTSHDFLPAGFSSFMVFLEGGVIAW